MIAATSANGEEHTALDSGSECFVENSSSGHEKLSFVKLRSASEFIDSIGVNIHLHYLDTKYEDFAFLKSKLLEVGIRHVRDGMIDTSWAGYYDRHNDLGRSGIRATFIAGTDQSADLWVSYPEKMKDVFGAYEGPNEYDLSGDPDWANKVESTQIALYNAVKRNSATSRFPVIGPSFASETGARVQQRLSQYLDFGNMHNYFAGRHPGTTGWGLNGYGSIEWNMELASSVSGTKSLMSTETGYYNSADIPGGVLEVYAGRYIPRIYLEHFGRGIARTYIYELVDQGKSVEDKEANFGLLRSDGTVKPAFTALKSLIAVFSQNGVEQGSGRVPHQELVPFHIAEDTGSLRKQYFRRGDGSLLAVLWLEVPAFDVERQIPLAVPQQSVTIAMEEPCRGTAVLHTLEDNGEMSRSPLVWTDGMLKVLVSDRVSIVELRRR